MKKYLLYSAINICIVICALSVFVTPVNAQVLTDPTLPKAQIKSGAKSKKQSADGEKAKALVLESIFRGTNKQTVIISGKSYQLGDTVRDMEITKITANEVELTKNSKSITMSLNKYDIKKS